MPLKREGNRDNADAMISDVVQAIYEIAHPYGPTDLIVEHGQDTTPRPPALTAAGRRILDEATEKAEEEKPVRFDFPAGASAEAIANALTEARQRIMAEHAAKQQPKND